MAAEVLCVQGYLKHNFSGKDLLKTQNAAPSTSPRGVDLHSRGQNAADFRAAAAAQHLCVTSSSGTEVLLHCPVCPLQVVLGLQKFKKFKSHLSSE